MWKEKVRRWESEKVMPRTAFLVQKMAGGLRVSKRSWRVLRQSTVQHRGGSRQGSRRKERRICPGKDFLS